MPERAVMLDVAIGADVVECAKYLLQFQRD
jgi:hypothetical protein